MASCTQRFRAIDPDGRALSDTVWVDILLRNGTRAMQLVLPPGRTISASLTSGYYYHAKSSHLGWQSSNESEFRACTSSVIKFVFDDGGGVSPSYDTCSQYIRAEDQLNNPLLADYDLYDEVDGKWHLCTHGRTIADGIGSEMFLTPGTFYKVVADDMSGYVTPEDHTWTACQIKDVILEYEDKSIICKPGKRKCDGKDIVECNSEGTGWDFVKTCPSGCSGGRCIDTVCTPNAFRCNGDNVEQCKSDGSGWRFVKTCDYGCEGAGVCKSAPVSGTPAITAITWAPLSRNTRISSGGQYTYNDHTLKVTAIGGSPLKATLNIDGTGNFDRAEGETFAFAGRAWQMLSISCGPECDYINIAKTTTATRPVASEAVTFAATVAWNDDGENQTSRVVEWWCAPQSSSCMSSSDLDAGWSIFGTSNSGVITHTFSDASIKYIRAKARNKGGKISEWFGDNGCKPGFFFAPEAAPSGTTPGFKIKVTNAAADNLIIRKASYNSTIRKWELGGLIGEWEKVGNGDYLAIKTESVGCGSFDPAPDTCGVYKLETGKQYAVYRAQMNLFTVEPEDVYKLGSGITNVTVSQCYESILEATVCNWLGISGSECTNTVAELNDVVFVGNYVHALSTGKNMDGSSRELTMWDTLAMPFALVGMAASQVPLGQFITKGAKYTGETLFSKAAIRWMETVAVKIPDIMGQPGRTMSFAEAIVQCNPGSSIDNIMAAIEANRFGEALELLEHHADVDVVGRWKWSALNNAMYRTIGKENTQRILAAGDIISTQVLKGAAKASVNVGDIADQANDVGILRDGAAMLKGAAHATDDMARRGEVARAKALIEKIANAFDHVPKYLDELTEADRSGMADAMADVVGDARAEEIMRVSGVAVEGFVEKWTDIFSLVIRGSRTLSKADVESFLRHMSTSATPATEFWELTRQIDCAAALRKAGGTAHGKVLLSFFDEMDHIHMMPGNNADVVRSSASAMAKSLGSTEPSKAADMVSTGADIVRKQHESAGNIGAGAWAETFGEAEDLAGDLIDNADDLAGTHIVGKPASAWGSVLVDRLKKRARLIAWRFNSMSETQRTMILWFTVDNLPFYVYMILKIKGIAPGDAGWAMKDRMGAVENLFYLVRSADESNNAELMGELVPKYKKAIDELKRYLDAHRSALERSDVYSVGSDAYDVYMIDYAYRLKRLDEMGGAVPGKTGKIRATAKTEAGKGVRCVAEIKGTKSGDVYRVLGDVYQSGSTFSGIAVGAYDVRMTYSGYNDCITRISVNEGETTNVDCVFKAGACPKPVPKIEFEWDEKQPLKFSFYGSAVSPTSIISWAWNMDGEKVLYSKDANYTFRSTGKKRIQLTVRNACGSTTIEKTVNAGACQKPVPNFTYSPDYIEDGMPVSFKGSSTTDSDISRWEWDFGDGKKAYSKNTSHTFSIPAKRNVQLTVEDTCGVGTVTKVVIIDEGKCDDWVTGAMITKNITSPKVGDTVKFTASANSDSTINKWYWTLPDGSHSTKQSISVKMVSRGYYELSVRITNICDNSATAKLKIWVDPVGGGEKTTVTIKVPKGSTVYW